MIKPLAPNPAMLLVAQDTRTLVIADLHIGWELALSNKGIHVPSLTSTISGRITALLSEYKPDTLLVLGDVKHTVASAGIGEWHDIPSLFDTLKKHVKSIWIVRGNHDGNLDALLPDNVELLAASGVIVENTAFFHGHQWPPPAILKCKTLVMAHVHPVVCFRDLSGFRAIKQIWVRAECDTTQLSSTLLKKTRLKTTDNQDALLGNSKVRPQKSQLFIMPSFNDFLGGRPLNERKIDGSARERALVGPILRSEGVNLADAELFLVDGTFLGKLRQFTIND